jgi:hypothetical protein
MVGKSERAWHPQGRRNPAEARYQPGSEGQLIAYVPSLDRVVIRQAGSSGDWENQEYLRCDFAVVMGEK